MRWLMIGTIAAAAVAWTGAAWGACACSGLTVTAKSDKSRYICTVGRPGFPECSESKASIVGCPAKYKWAYKCPTGVNHAADVNQQVGFQAAAALTGTASQCKSGQALQLTVTSDRSVSKPPIHATPAGGVRTIGGYAFYTSNTTTDDMPNVGTTISVSSTTYPLYGGDNYTSPADGTLIEIDDSRHRIVWWDNTDQGKERRRENAKWEYKFISFIQGTVGQASCACVLDITVDWPKYTDATTTVTKDTTNSSNCTVN